MGRRGKSGPADANQPVVVPGPVGRQRPAPRKAALKRLGLEEIPPIPRMALDAIRVVGTKARFLDYARASDDERVQAVLEKWDSLSPTDQQALALTDICLACDCDFATLLGAVTSHAYEHNSDVSRLVAAVNQPKVVKATVESATKFTGPDGWKDRQMLLTHSNFLPVPNSSRTIFHLQQQINNRGPVEPDSEPSGLPSFEADVVSFNQAQRGKALPAPIIDAET